ncbi:unnamed protein product [Microthlaspi erraticum]|uniref:SWIM-type domain-containing protein n=1 Tax=Microthlaspi erraticum TaxID=1685480 RepID=A0A6D2IKB2_9BRAS|nr:unnamed protein product [Microthlaspi erraticum]
MVFTTEDRLVRVVNGRWARTSDCGWLFIANERNAAKKLRIREGNGYSRNKQIVVDGFGLSSGDGDVCLTFQWPEWMDVDSAAWKKTCPVTITNDEAMDIYFAMVAEKKELPLLYISQLSVDDSVDAKAIEILEAKGKNVMEEDDWQHFVQEDAHEVLAGMQIDHAECEGDELFVGRVFKTKRDCQVKLSVYAFSQDRSIKKLTALTCMFNSCTWRVYIVKLEGSESYQITSGNLRHTCSVKDRRRFNKQAKEKFMRRIIQSGNAGGLQKLLLDDHKRKVCYWKAWSSQEVANDQGAMGSSSDDSFASLPSYLWLLRQANPGSVMDLKTEADACGLSRFKSLFFAFAASLKGFRCMRRVIVLDGAHLRGRFPGCLLTASCQDPNFENYPLAFAVANEEDDDSWDWFLRKLNTVIPDSADLVFVSKWQSSIYTSIRQVYPKASHGVCVVHLHRHVCSVFNSRHLADLVVKAARAFRVDDFHAAFAEIGRIEPECASYLEEIGFNHWTRSHFMGNRFNIMTSNVAECVNAAFKEARELPIVSLLGSIQRTMTTWFAMRLEATKAEPSCFPPKVRELIHQSLETSEGFTARRIDAFEYEVKGDSKRSFYVHLRQKKCTCRAYNLLGIPCSHAMCAAMAEGFAIHELLDL